MFNDVARKAEQEAKKKQQEREKELTLLVDKMMEVIKNADISTVEAIMVVKNVESRIDRMVGAKPIKSLF